jgi:hypothetical protein
MSHFPEDLRTYIVGSTAVTALIGTRCHYSKTPQASARPNVWFRVASDTEELTMDGVGGLHEATCDIECVALTEGSAQDVADAIKTRLSGYKGAAGNATAQAMFLRDKDDSYVPFSNESDEGVHVVAYTLTAWYTT